MPDEYVNYAQLARDLLEPAQPYLRFRQSKHFDQFPRTNSPVKVVIPKDLVDRS